MRAADLDGGGWLKQQGRTVGADDEKGEDGLEAEAGCLAGMYIAREATRGD